MRVWLTKRTKIRRGGDLIQIDYDIPDAWVDWQDASVIAAELGEKIRTKIAANTSSGKDATGQQLQISAATAARRRDAMQPPVQSSRRARYGRSGRALKPKPGTAYAERYPAGGSKGGSTALVDSGLLAAGVRVSVSASGTGASRATATVDIPRDRLIAVLAIEKGSGTDRLGRRWHTFGGVPHPIFALSPRDLEDAADVASSRAVAGCQKGGGLGAFGSFIARGLGRGAGTLGVLGLIAVARGLL